MSIKQILTEDNVVEKYINRLIPLLHKPYFINLNKLDVPKVYWNRILSNIFNDNVKIEYTSIYNSNGKEIYFEDSDGHWKKYEYDSNENEIYNEDSDGFWEKREYDSNGNVIYHENSNGHWRKYEYNSNGNEIYYEDSDGFWEKREYDSNGNVIYRENSNGKIIDKRTNNINENININVEERYINRIFNIIKNNLDYHPMKGLIINLGDIGSMINKNNGINITLKKDGIIGEKIKNYLVDNYGVTEDESLTLWSMIRMYLLKLNFIEIVDYIIYEDFLEFQSDPYYYDDLSGKPLNVKNLKDFIKLMKIIGVGDSSYDPHSNESINFLELLNVEDYEYIQENLLQRIASENGLISENIKNKKSLNENSIYDDTDYFNDNIFNDKIYEGFYKQFDKNPNNIFKLLNFLDLYHEEFTTSEIEINLIYKYLTQYENRTPSYISFELDSEELSDMFYDDREYGIREMVKNYLDMEYDYGHDYECFDVDDWLFDKIDSENMGRLKTIYEESLDGGEGTDEDFKEFILTEFNNEIGCSAGDAQFSSDIESLHNDFISGIEDYLSGLDGKLTETKDGIKFIGTVEIGDLVQSPYFIDILGDYLDSGYPSDFSDIFYDIKGRELNGYHSEYNYFFPEELIRINTDKHFRYGGAGNIDWTYFNEILSDRLNDYK